MYTRFATPQRCSSISQWGREVCGRANTWPMTSSTTWLRRRAVVQRTRWTDRPTERPYVVTCGLHRAGSRAIDARARGPLPRYPSIQRRPRGPGTEEGPGGAIFTPSGVEIYRDGRARWVAILQSLSTACRSSSVITGRCRRSLNCPFTIYPTAPVFEYTSRKEG